MSKWHHLTDDMLVAAYQDGCDDAFDELLYRYKDKLFSYIFYTVRNKNLAEDLFQEVFCKVITTLRDKRYTAKDGGMALNGKAPCYFAEATAASASAIILSMRAVAEQPPPQRPEHEPHISFSPHMPFFIIRRTDRHTQTIKIASTTTVAIFITIAPRFNWARMRAILSFIRYFTAFCHTRALN